MKKYLTLFIIIVFCFQNLNVFSQTSFSKILQVKAQNNEVENKTVSLYNEAVDEHTKGDLDKAEELYNEVISEDDNFFLAKYNLAKIYPDKEKYDDSITLLNSIPQNEKQNIFLVKKTIGIIHYLRGDLKKAKKAFTALSEINPDSYEPYFHLGLIYEKKKSFKKAKENFNKAVELKPDLAEAHHHLDILNLVLNKKN